MLAGIRDILVITTPAELPLFQALLGDGGQWGLRLAYAAQPKPEGLAQAFVIGRDFVGDDPVCLILGDNIFFGHGLTDVLREAAANREGAVVFGQWVRDPERYGVVELDDAGQPVAIEEKPKAPRSNWAVTGIYFYDNRVLDVAAAITPSPRGELEITDVNRWYLERAALRVERLGRGFAWLDMGTHETLLEAGAFIQTIERRQGLKIACPEEIAYTMGFIGADELRRLAEPLRASGYGQYLLSLVDGERA